MVRWILLTFLGAGVIVLAMGVYTEVVAEKVKEPPFETVMAEGAFSVRTYPPMVLASVTVEGERSKAINAGFRMLADYIFGGNLPDRKIAMTAPVMQTPRDDGQEIAMTAPVMQEPADGTGWVVSFVLPAGLTVDAAPMPVNQAVRLSETQPQRMAVVRFSGFNTNGALDKRTQELVRWMDLNGLKATGAPRFAFYDPPWTLPFLRRNEVMVPVAQ